MMLRTLQAAANNQKSQAPLTWQALQNQGVPIGYDEFAARWDSQDPNDQILHKLVDRFDGHGLVIKTKEKDMPGQTDKKGEVEKMAKRATKLGK